MTLARSHRRALGAALLTLTATCAGQSPLADVGAALTAPTIDFVEPPIVDLRAPPNAVAVADFDGDGKPDLAASTGASGVALALARDGGFAPPRVFAAGNAAALVTGDFDGDGKPDLAVLNEDGVGLLLGLGDGTFAALRGFAAGGARDALVVGDFDRDGKLDLAALNSAAGSVAVLLGNGDGTFQPAQPYAVPTGARWLAAGEVDGDGKPDLLVVHPDGRGAPLLGKGDGTFRVGVVVGTIQPRSAYFYTAVAMGDVDGDGKLDLAYAIRGDFQEATLTVALGQGDGTFRPAGGIGGRRLSPTAIALGDLDGDGKLDLIGGLAHGGVVLTALTRGGSLGPSMFHAAPASVLWTADVDGDGKTDVLAPAGNGVAVLTSNGDGSLHAPRAFHADARARRLAVGDFDGDGISDIAVSWISEVGDGLQIFLGDGRGGLRAGASYYLGDYFSSYAQLVAADVNGDGKLDLVSAQSAGVLLGNGDGTFRGMVVSDHRDMAKAVVIADFDGDGAPDLVRYLPGLTFLPGKGDGTFLKDHAQAIAVDGAVKEVAAADLDGDGKPDLAVATDTGLFFLAGKGDGSFQPARRLGDVAAATALAVADLDGDGRPDIVVAHARDEASTVLLNAGGGAFRSAGEVPSTGSLRVRDLDGDGIPDLVVAGGTIVAHRGRGDGTFEARRVVGGGGMDVALAQLDRGGLPDVVATQGWVPFLWVVRNCSR